MELPAVAALAVGLVYLAHRLRRRKRHTPALDEGFGHAMTALKRAEGHDDDRLSG